MTRRGPWWRFGAGDARLVDTWRRVAGELGGHVIVDRKDRPRFLHIPHREWTLVTDTFTQSHGETSSTFTRTRALFHGRQPLKLTVTRRTPLHAIGRLVGYLPVPMGYQQLDRALFVRSDRPEIARAVLRGTALGQSMMRDPSRLMVTQAERKMRKTAGDGLSQVVVQRKGKIRDVAALRALVQTAALALDELERFGVAEDRPVVAASL
ncbi:MAG: hypothetical protein R3195_03090 [Gemmatimonadota bacterium]|nr:hypothetical protein [Gemmatimonadota bacterium]